MNSNVIVTAFILDGNKQVSISLGCTNPSPPPLTVYSHSCFALKRLVTLRGRSVPVRTRPPHYALHWVAPRTTHLCGHDTKSCFKQPWNKICKIFFDKNVKITVTYLRIKNKQTKQQKYFHISLSDQKISN